MDQRLGIRFDHYPTVGNAGRHRKQWHFASLTPQGTLNKLARNYLALKTVLVFDTTVYYLIGAQDTVKLCVNLLIYAQYKRYPHTLRFLLFYIH